MALGTRLQKVDIGMDSPRACVVVLVLVVRPSALINEARKQETKKPNRDAASRLVPSQGKSTRALVQVGNISNVFLIGIY